MTRLLRTRVQHTAFHPNGEQRILFVANEVFAVLRISPRRDQHILCLTNVTAFPVSLNLPLEQLCSGTTSWFDLLAGRGYQAQECKLQLMLDPYAVLWLTPFAELEKRIEQPG